ncbi:pentapeptide repeat-containing protein [Streptomyces sp. NPDC056399]|uniref:pentapeptide repeat-containing protein n=1 Tax=Streptomyces sp. NPDC056399 TaxID=3345807 RepID=UPI0035D8DDAA
MALREPVTGLPRTGYARFDEATFTGEARFDGVTFTGPADFNAAMFTGTVVFGGAMFANDAWFRRAIFTNDAWFMRATFAQRVDFDGAVFHASAWFTNASFETTTVLGPLICSDFVQLGGATFGSPVTISVAAKRLGCQRTRWASTATLRLRYVTADLTDAVFEYPLSVATHPQAFDPQGNPPYDESLLAGLRIQARVTSISGTNAAHLVLNDLDLSGCRFSGTFHLDQIRLDGCRFPRTPSGIRRTGIRLARWTPRQTLLEEHHWRAWDGQSGWTAAPTGEAAVGPAGLSRVYRQLRKSLEDGKSEPDAADFYYGEMEMRRQDRSRPFGERALLAAYWAVSGYGLRASRALGWLLTAMTATVFAMMLWGLPQDDPKPRSTGELINRQITLTTDTPSPVNPKGPLGERLNSERFEKSLRVVVNSVVFRSSGQGLTTVGTYTEMASRIAEPVLLGLAVLAVRSRVKR